MITTALALLETSQESGVFESLVGFFADYPYVGVFLMFFLCGLGLPVPEEIILLASGYICYKFPEQANLYAMIAACAGSILFGDSVPFALGRTFGARLLRVRPLRWLASRDRLASFDKWFQRRGDLVIFLSRFIPGIRVVAFFTAGTMKMSWRRFLFLDALGVAMIVPALVYLPYRFGAEIEEVIEKVRRWEQGILWSALGGIVIGVLWYYLRKRRARIKASKRPKDTFVQPTIRPRRPVARRDGDGAESPLHGPPAPGALVETAPEGDLATPAPFEGTVFDLPEDPELERLASDEVVEDETDEETGDAETESAAEDSPGEAAREDTAK